MAEAQRRLTTIVVADVAGFSRLIGVDEEGTLAAQRSHRAELIEPLLMEYHGRIANTAGDSFLFEFSSAVEAVRYSIAVQERMAERNRDMPTDRRIEYRIGINVGDVVADGDDLLGDGVNITARLENICEPGGIMLADDAYRQVRDRLDVNWQDGGEREVKNIARPIRVWTWLSTAHPSLTGAENDLKTLTLPDKPSIAVLPFQNMSQDPEQEFFADGMAEDIITALSRYRSLFVIARNSTFAYKGQSPDLRDVARDLGVKFVLEGSIRKGGSMIRVTAQLIEGNSGNHIWAERYDRELDDIFALQDEITQTIVAAIGPEIDQFERERAQRLPPDNLDAWESYQRALWHVYRFSKGDNAEAQRLFKQAIIHSPNFAPAHAGFAHALYFSFMHGYADDRPAALTHAFEAARAAVAIDDRDADAHFALGRILYLRRMHEASLFEFKAAVTVNPSLAHAHLGYGSALGYSGQWERAIESLDRALRLSPHDPVIWVFSTARALWLMGSGRIEDAAESAAHATRQPTAEVTAHIVLTAALAHLDREEEGRRAFADALSLKPDIDAAYVGEIFPFEDPANLEFILAGLRRAGLTD